MLASALNFAIGFFGYPLDGKYEQSIILESGKDKVREYCRDLTPGSGLNSRTVQQYPCALYHVRFGKETGGFQLISRLVVVRTPGCQRGAGELVGSSPNGQTGTYPPLVDGKPLTFIELI